MKHFSQKLSFKLKSHVSIKCTPKKRIYDTLLIILYLLHGWNDNITNTELSKTVIKFICFVVLCVMLFLENSK